MSSKKLLDEIIAAETHVASLRTRFAEGCVYNHGDESESRIGPNGLTQIRTRTWREVVNCKDSAYDIPRIYSEWSDWR